MARLFSGSAGSILELASAFGLTAPPCSLLLTFKRTVVSTTGYMVSVSNGSASPQMMAAYLTATQFEAQAYDGTGNGEALQGSAAADWNTGCASFVTTTSRYAYVNAIPGVQNTVSVSVSGLNTLTLGALNSAFGGYAGVTLARVAGWDVTLSDEEIASYAKGFSPRRIRPQSLKFYIPALRDLIEWRTGQAFATSGGTVVDQTLAYGT